jgi:hypothetical protein
MALTEYTAALVFLQLEFLASDNPKWLILMSYSLGIGRLFGFEYVVRNPLVNPEMRIVGQPVVSVRLKQLLAQRKPKLGVDPQIDTRETVLNLL